MALTGELAFVFVAGLVTALATGLGALPFFFVEDVSDRWRVGLWGLASGIMLAASGFGLFREALNYGCSVEVAAGALVGVALVLDGFLPEAREAGQALPNDGTRELADGLAAGGLGMAPMLLFD